MSSFQSNPNLPANLIPSTTPGMAWDISVHKPQGRPAYVSALEVTPTRGGFSCEIMTCRSHRVMLNGRNTINHRRDAVTNLLAEMVGRNWVTVDDAAAFKVA